MPSKNKVNDLRDEIVTLLNTGNTPTQIAHTLACSRTTVYKVRDLLQDPNANLQDQRTSNTGRPTLYEDAIWELLLQMRTSNQTLGATMLYHLVCRNATHYGIQPEDVPAPATIGRWITKEGLAQKPVGPRDFRVYPDAKPTRPGTITLDTWGPWRCRAQRLYAITVSDRYTRAASLVPLAAVNGTSAQRMTSQSWPQALQLAHLLVEPKTGIERVYVDNGIGMVPAFGILPQGARYALHYGARLIFIPPGQPWRNGTLERFHYTMEREYFREAFPASIREALAGLHEWLNYYNCDRPHSSLKYKAPADIYDWLQPFADPPWQFPPPERIEPVEGIVEAIRMVNNDGTIQVWQKPEVRFTDVLAGQYVRLQFLVNGAPSTGRILYTQRKNEPLVVATFNHTLDKVGRKRDEPLITDLVTVDFDPGVVPQNQGLDQSQLDSQRARIAKRTAVFREANESS